MTGKFLISGFPRCRTAWLSVAATTPFSLCHHEPTAWTDSFEDMASIWKSGMGQSVGFSDAALSLHIERVLEEIKPRTLLVLRPIDDVLASFKAYLSPSGVPFDEEWGRSHLESLVVEIDKVRQHPLVRIANFDDLHDYSAVLSLLSWLLPNQEFPDLRSLMSMNIQVDLAHVLALLRKPHNRWYLRKCSTSKKSAPG